VSFYRVTEFLTTRNYVDVIFWIW